MPETKGRTLEEICQTIDDSISYTLKQSFLSTVKMALQKCSNKKKAAKANKEQQNNIIENTRL